MEIEIDIDNIEDYSSTMKECYFCDLKSKCIKQQEKRDAEIEGLLEAVDYPIDDLVMRDQPTFAKLPKPENLSDEQLLTVVKASKALTEWLDQAKGEALVRRKDRDLPDITIVSRASTLAWVNSKIAELISLISDKNLDSVATKTTILTPTQMLKVLSKSQIKDLNLEEFYSKGKPIEYIKIQSSDPLSDLLQG